jgi:hypothetical protein
MNTIFLNIAELRTRKGSSNVQVSVSGGVTANDGLGGNYYWDNASTESDNGGSIIAVTGVATGRWKKLTNYLPASGGTVTGKVNLGTSNINTTRVGTKEELDAIRALGTYVGLVLVASDSSNLYYPTLYLVFNSTSIWIPTQND